MFGTQRNLYSTDLHLSFRIGGNANFRFGVGGKANFRVFIYQHVGIPNAKFSRVGVLPNARPQHEGFCVAVEYRLKGHGANWSWSTAFEVILIFIS